MTSLLDIGPSFETVEVNGVSIQVSGISLEGLVSLVQRFPKLRELITGEGADLDEILSLGGPVLGAVIAAGCGNLNSKEHEKVAASLPLQAQLDFIVAIMRATMPEGPGPFLDRLRLIGLGPEPISENSSQMPPQNNAAII